MSLSLIKKFFVLAFLIIFCLILTTISAVYSETPLEKARQDYTFQTTKYQDAYEKYQNAKINHQAFNTATSKNEAFLKTKDYLVQVPNVYISYLFLVNERANQFDWAKGPFSKDPLQNALTERIKDMENLKTEAENLQTLESTENFAAKLQDHISTKTLPTAYEFLAKTEVAQLADAKYDFVQEASKIDAYSQSKVSTQDQQLFLNWQSEIQKTSEEMQKQIESMKLKAEETVKNKQFNFGATNFEFSTENERQIYKPTPALLKEILTIL